MNYAYLKGTEKWVQHSMFGTWTMKVNDAITPPVVVPVVPPVVTPLVCDKYSWSTFYLQTCYDQAGAAMVFKVTIPNNSWFSIGFGGSTMKNVDMIAWFAD